MESTNNIFINSYDTTNNKFINSQVHVNREPYYYIVRDFNIEKVGLIFFSKQNVDKIQQMIKELIKEYLNVELTQDQNVQSLLMVMRNIYLQDGRFLNYEIQKQVNDLNLKLLNTILPDIITSVKQQLEYLNYIEKPMDPINRPLNDSVKGSKKSRPISNLWGF